MVTRGDTHPLTRRKSPPRSRSYSRSRSRSLSSSDVASTRASERSFHEPPAKPSSQLPQHSLPSKPPTSAIPAKRTLLPARPIEPSRLTVDNKTLTPNAQQPLTASVNASISAAVPTSFPAKPSTSITSVKLTTEAKPDSKSGGTPGASIPKIASAKQLAIETEMPGLTADKPNTPNGQFLCRIDGAVESYPSIAPLSSVGPSHTINDPAKGTLTTKTSRASKTNAQNNEIVSGSAFMSNRIGKPPLTASSISGPGLIGKEVRGQQTGAGFSSPLSSPERTNPDRSFTLDPKKPNTTGEAIVMLPPPTKPTDTSDMTTDDEDLPNWSEARSVADALRIVVMTRLRCDRQTREERVAPVLMANRSIAQVPSSRPSTSPEELILEFTEGGKLNSVREAFARTEPYLKLRFAQNHDILSEKTNRLREEYLSLHEQWHAHCIKLDSKSTKKTKDVPVAIEEVAVVPPSSGRSTRRTAAMLGDAVRSDLEMEQIIASLGVEELTDPNHLALRNLAKIPDMITVSHGQVDYLFDDTNNLVDDPINFYESSVGIDSWTEEEKEVFLEQFAANPKQFGIIASFLPAKTAAQCVTFYYLHKKKHIDFRKVISQYAPGKRKRGGRRTDKQKGNALMADIRQHDDEVTLSHSGPTTRRKRRTVLSAAKPVSSRLGVTRMELTPTSTPTPDPEPEARKRGRRPNRIIIEDMDEETVSDFCILRCKTCL